MQIIWQRKSLIKKDYLNTKLTILFLKSDLQRWRLTVILFHESLVDNGAYEPRMLPRIPTVLTNMRNSPWVIEGAYWKLWNSGHSFEWQDLSNARPLKLIRTVHGYLKMKCSNIIKNTCTFNLLGIVITPSNRNRTRWMKFYYMNFHFRGNQVSIHEARQTCMYLSRWWCHG